jgi:site-specific recombinase XerD
MIECLQLRGLSERTQEAYVRAVRQLAEHYHKAPDLITEEELRQYFLYIKNVKHYARNTMTIAICGLKFFFERTLEKDWTTFGLVRPAPEKKLPVILSVAEVRQILGRIRLPRYKVCLTTIYSCGLRLQEGANLRVADIDSARQMIHVRHGKGAKDRPSAKTSRRMSGSLSSRVCCCRCLTSWSPSPCPQSCARWPAASRS